MSLQTITTDTLSNTVALLIFKVQGQTYSLPINSVVRVIEMVTMTHLPNTSDIIQGIINLQGKAVPIIDLRHRFKLEGMLPPAYGLHTPIILAEVRADGQILGLIVDAVEDVLQVPAEHIAMTDTFFPAELMKQVAVPIAYLAGVANIDQRMILVLNVRALLTPAEQSQLSETLDNQTKSA